MMLIYILLNTLAYLATVRSRDIFGKAFKSIPSASNSLVNLGKIDIAFYMNGKPQDYARKPEQLETIPFVSQKPCPCTGPNFFQSSSQNHPFELIEKIFSSNNLLSFKQPSSSMLCCDSHEHVQEDILFEFTPKQSQVIANPINSNYISSHLAFENFPVKQTLPSMPIKNRAIEILLFPKRKDIVSATLEKTFPKKTNVKEEIKIVGEKDVRNEFKAVNLPPLPFIKKDLTVLDKTKPEIKISEDNKAIEKMNAV